MLRPVWLRKKVEHTAVLCAGWQRLYQHLHSLCRRVLRCLCICCCRCCCVKPAPYPEEILGTTRQAIIKAIIVLLSLGVCACCAYGMSQIDPQLVSKGLSVINNLKVCLSSFGYVVTLLRQAWNMLCRKAALLKAAPASMALPDA